jgi:glycosyltransferase involved in cell wall biosynthesis
MVVWIQNPFDNLPGEGFRKMRYSHMACAFAELGHDVTVWTSDFSHARKCRREIAEPAIDPRVKVRLVPTMPYARNVSFKRVLSHVLYARTWIKQARKEAALSGKPSIIITSFPTISAAAYVMRFARSVGAKAVVDVQDAWPQTFERVFPRSLLKPLRIKAKKIFREAHLVTGVCERYRSLTGRSDYYKAYLGIEVANEENKVYATARTNSKIAYIGGTGVTYDLSTAARAADKLGMQLVVAGGKNPLGRDELEAMLLSCDVGLIPMNDDAWVGIPNKMFDYAKADLPIVSSLGGESAGLIGKYKCGATFTWGDADSLAEAVNAALKLECGASLKMCKAEFDAKKIYAAYAEKVLSSCS